MHSALLMVLFAAVIVGCAGTSTTEVNAATERWRQRIAIEIPTGTEASVAKQWFENQGLKPFKPVLARGREADDMEVWLETLPAREWYCDKWMLQVRVTVSPDGKVAKYDLNAVGHCL